MAREALHIIEEEQPSREDALELFLALHGWARAERTPVSWDASFRRYHRLRMDGQTAILMDAPPDKEKVRPYLSVRQWYEQRGYSVPALYASDPDGGFLLLEDLGDDSYTRVLEADPAREAALYANAIDVVAKTYFEVMDGQPFEPYTHRKLLEESALLGEWLLPVLLGTPKAEEAASAFLEALGGILDKADLEPVMLVHRDYHADNLFLLDDREGICRVGLLDFQDAVIGRPAYDLVSLLEDARRDVSPATVEASLERFIAATGTHPVLLREEYALLGAQRNAKILGIFARLCRRDSKPRYLRYIPRVWGHFLHDLEHPLLEPVRDWADAYLRDDTRALLLDPDALEAKVACLT